MAVFVKVGEHSIDVEDLPISVYTDIERETGHTWIEVLQNPIAHSSVFTFLVLGACEQWQIEPPLLTPRTLIDMFEVRKDEETRPEEFDGGLPLEVMPDGTPLEGSEAQTD